MNDIDTGRLPLSGPVLDVSEHHDGRMRVTFKNLAAIYFIAEDCPERDALLEAVHRSKDTGEELALTYDLDGKRLTGFQ
jgi:hypothetical protein